MKQPRGQSGLTLIELMVTVLLASILVGGLFYMASGQQRTYSSQMRLLASQENLWSAMEYLHAEVRKAGFGLGGCTGELRTLKPLDGAVPYDSGAMPTLRIVAMQVFNSRNTFSGSTTDGTDSLDLRYVGYDTDGGMGAEIRVTHANPPQSGSLGAEHFYVDHTGGIQDNDLIAICAPSLPWGLVLKVTHIDTEPCNGSGHDEDGDGNPDCKIGHNQGQGDGWNESWGQLKQMNILPPGGFPENATVSRLGGLNDVRHYAVDNTRNPPQLVTWTTSTTDREVVADGIEDMQISWTCDPDGDGLLEEGACVESTGDGVCDCNSGDDCTARTTDEWANNTPGDTVPGCAGRGVRMVRITLVARTASAIPGDKRGFRPAAEDHAAGTVAQDLVLSGDVGTYGRAVLTAEVQPRNIR